MDISDWIGFLVAMVFVVFSMWRRGKGQKKPEAATPPSPESEDVIPQSREEQYKELMETLGVPMEEAPEPPPPSVQVPSMPERRQQAKPQRKVSDDFQFQATLDARHQKSDINERLYDTRVQPKIRGDYEDRLVSKDLRLEAAKRQGKVPVKLEKGGKSALRQYVIGHEVLSPPRAFRGW